MSHVIIAPTKQADAFERFCLLFETVNQQSRDSFPARLVRDTKMHNRCSSARNPVEEITEAVTIGVQGNNYLAESGVFLKRAFREKAQRLCIEPMQQHYPLKVRRWKTRPFKCNWVAHCCPKHGKPLLIRCASLHSRALFLSPFQGLKSF